MNERDFHQLAQMTRGVILSLTLAVDDLENGHYAPADRERLADYLDRLSAALCADSQRSGGLVVNAENAPPVRVIDSRRVDR